MNLNRKLLTNALKATTELARDSASEIFRFSDNRLRYEMWLQPNSDTAFLAIDSEEPVQACPMIEYSFRCTDIEVGISAYSSEGDEVAVRFYDNEISQAGLRLKMTWISDGYWYIWANANTKPYAGNGG